MKINREIPSQIRAIIGVPPITIREIVTRVVILDRIIIGIRRIRMHVAKIEMMTARIVNETVIKSKIVFILQKRE